MFPLIQLYVDLKDHYQDYIKPPIARDAVKNAIPVDLYFENQYIYNKLYVEFFFFYVLYSQNTRNIMSEKILVKIFSSIRLLNFQYDLILYKSFFYKHKEDYYCALVKLLNLYEKKDNRMLFIQEFVNIKRVGYKSTALIFNEFFDWETWPVVDVNVYKGYIDLQKKYNLEKINSPDKLFFLLLKLNNFCDDNTGFNLARLLYSYRKYFSKAKKIKQHKCPVCIV